MIGLIITFWAEGLLCRRHSQVQSHHLFSWRLVVITFLYFIWSLSIRTITDQDTLTIHRVPLPWNNHTYIHESPSLPQTAMSAIAKALRPAARAATTSTRPVLRSARQARIYQQWVCSTMINRPNIANTVPVLDHCPPPQADRWTFPRSHRPQSRTSRKSNPWWQTACPNSPTTS